MSEERVPCSADAAQQPCSRTNPHWGVIVVVKRKLVLSAGWGMLLIHNPGRFFT